MALVIAGIILGLLSATVTESIGHKYAGHPGPRQRNLYRKFPRLMAPFLKPYYQHLVIHHHRTFKADHFEQFESQLEKEKLDAWIRKKFSPEFAGLIWLERYNLTLEGISGTLPFALPFLLGPLLILFTLGPVAFLASLLTAFIPVWLSKYVHPLVHLPQETEHEHPFIRWLMRTRYMRHVFRNHYLHHQHLEKNFNLLLGGDYLVGLHHPASAEENARLQALTAEFDRRVRLGPSTAPAPALSGKALPKISLAEFVGEERKYLSQENPNFEGRFQHMKRKAEAYRAAELTSLREILTFRDEGRVDYGMHVYQKNLSLDTWAHRPEFSLEAYEAAEEGVYFRGIKFTTGDLLLTNQDCDSDGLFSTLLEEQINFSHVAMFCLLNYRGKLLPSVLEINEMGVRAIPLKAMASERFNTYLEIYRLRAPLSRAEKERINSAAITMMQETHAFDIYQDDTQTKYLNCARTVAELFRSAGVEPIPATSQYHPRTFRNLEFLGIDACAQKSMLMPDDFIRSQAFRIEGSIDNGRFVDVVARGLMRERIQEIWRTKFMDRKNFPTEFLVNRFVINGIKQNRWYAPGLLRAAGFSRDQFPSGPLMFLSLVPTANRLMKQGSRTIRRGLQARPEKVMDASSWQSLTMDEEVRALVLRGSERFARLYRPSSATSPGSAMLPVKANLPGPPALTFVSKN
ncbi:MAG: hypothetical protein EOP11_00645 [Proteobacteria bacterium]|nr:MAG: hypothetical protein EOP11_00645 [Pseudomonadota bacterium]